MGLDLDFLGDVVTGAAKGFITSGGNPAGAFSGGLQGAEQATAENRLKNQQRAYNQYIQEQNKMAEIFGSGNVSTIQRPMVGGTTANAGFGAGFGQFLTDIGQNIVSPFSNLATSIAPFFGRSTQQPAVTTKGAIGGQETQVSGTTDAFIGGLPVSGLVGAGRSFLKSPFGQLITGTGAGLIAGSTLDGSPKQMRITRKMKSQARMVLNMTGGNLQAAADILGIDQNTLVFVLLKRFRNDGPVVTKASLRKTKQTVRRLKSMCDMYDDLRPRARAVRRTPTRRSTTTLIKN